MCRKVYRKLRPILLQERWCVSGNIQGTYVHDLPCSCPVSIFRPVRVLEILVLHSHANSTIAMHVLLYIIVIVLYLSLLRYSVSIKTGRHIEAGHGQCQCHTENRQTRSAEVH